MRFPLGVPLEPNLCLQVFSRYSAPKCLSSANRHCACAVSRDLYTLCKIWVHILISRPHIVYSLWHFYWAPMKNKGCLLVRPTMLNTKSSDNLSNFGLLRFLVVRGYKNYRLLVQKAHPCVNPRHLSHFA